jgi:hypothetical protein
VDHSAWIGAAKHAPWVVWGVRSTKKLLDQKQGANKMMKPTKLGETRIGGRRFQQGLHSLIEICRKAKTKPQQYCRIWTALVITSGRTWPDVNNMDASSPELTVFIRRNQKNLDRVWRKVITLYYIRGFPEAIIRWKEPSNTSTKK